MYCITLHSNKGTIIIIIIDYVIIASAAHLSQKTSPNSEN